MRKRIRSHGLITVGYFRNPRHMRRFPCEAQKFSPSQTRDNSFSDGGVYRIQSTLVKVTGSGSDGLRRLRSELGLTGDDSLFPRSGMFCREMTYRPTRVCARDREHQEEKIAAGLQSSPVAVPGREERSASLRLGGEDGICQRSNTAAIGTRHPRHACSGGREHVNRPHIATDERPELTGVGLFRCILGL